MKKNLCVILICMLMVITCACGANSLDTGSVDQNTANHLIGDYRIVAVETPDDPDDYIGGWWKLSIYSGENGAFIFSIFDCGAGNPGISGEIVKLDNSSITIKYDKSLYEDLPSAKWQLDGKYFTVEYERVNGGIRLINSGASVDFLVDEN